MAASVTCAMAQDASVAQFYGTVSVKKADGTVRILSRHSQVGSGDTFSTERDSYALIRFRDGALFLSADPGLQFMPPPTFIRSVMAGSVVNTGRNLECAITR
jgi:hypothetical protein